MKTTSAILLAATFGRGVTCQHVSKNIPVVGVYPNSPSELITSSQTEPTTSTAESDLIRALQLDNHVTGKKRTFHILLSTPPRVVDTNQPPGSYLGFYLASWVVGIERQSHRARREAIRETWPTMKVTDRPDQGGRNEPGSNQYTKT